MHNYQEMSGPQLVAAYNAMADTAGAEQVKKFTDRETGIRRCKALASTLKHVGVHPEDAVMAPAELPTAAFVIDFGPVRSGSNRDRLIKVLVDNLDNYVPLADIVTAVYGPQADVHDHKGPLSMVMKGISAIIEKRKMPVKLGKQKQGKEISFGLFKA